MSECVLHVAEHQPRLDRYLAAELPELSRSELQRLIAAGHVLVNDAPSKASYQPEPGDCVRVVLPARRKAHPEPEAMPLRVLYEDDDLLVIDKPAGLVVHPAPGHPSGTLVNALLAHRPEVTRADLDPERPGIVHRLDRDTTGLLVVAAHRKAQQTLQAAWRSRRVQKTYLAVVYGHLAPDRGAIEAPIGRDPSHRQRMAVLAEGGRYARTAYRVREPLRGATLVEAELITGRTHQLRVHLSAIGHAVVGDRVYGPRRPAIEAPRQCLHAWRLAFAHPSSGRPMHFEAPLPDDMAAVCARLR